MKKKPSIQKAILKSLSNKKTLSMGSIKERIKSLNHDKKENNSLNKTDYAITRSINNLLEDGLVQSFKTQRNNKYFRLTDEGQRKLNNLILESDSSLICTNWDGCWRIILLDLPEERKNEREALRYLLKKAGFVCLKNSVWISMLPFENLFNNIKKDLNLSTELMIIVADKIDEKTKKEFLNICKLK
jgi:DNA-binding transcriptional regulator PaaX